MGQDGSFRDALVLAAGRGEDGPLRAFLADRLERPTRERAPIGGIVPLDPALDTEARRARTRLERETARLLERIEAVQRDEARKLERTAEEKARALDTHLATGPGGSSVERAEWQRVRERRELEADIARATAERARERFEASDGARRTARAGEGARARSPAGGDSDRRAGASARDRPTRPPRPRHARRQARACERERVSPRGTIRPPHQRPRDDAREKAIAPHGARPCWATLRAVRTGAERAGARTRTGRTPSGAVAHRTPESWLRMVSEREGTPSLDVRARRRRDPASARAVPGRERPKRRSRS